jgi:serine protease SohB
VEIVYQYGLFLAKTVTIVAAIAVIIMLMVNARQRKAGQQGELQLTDLSEQYETMQENMQLARMDETERKVWQKEQKKKDKAEAKLKKHQAKTGERVARKPCLFVLNFKGSIDAREVSALREEITAVLAVAKSEDQVLLKLESPGGVVHGYGLAASQLMRIHNKGIKLTVTVDKVAASGGYMMACVADRIVAAPFAILGSIGVVAQVPNIHRLLKKNDIDVELHTAGEFKRTLTVLGENTEQGREKFREELNETHQLFKTFVHQNRPALDVDAVATGEHWFGIQAKEKGLVDDISTSDDVLLAELEKFELIGVQYIQRKKMIERFSAGAADGLDKVMLRWWQRGQKPLL